MTFSPHMRPGDRASAEPARSIGQNIGADLPQTAPETEQIGQGPVGRSAFVTGAAGFLGRHLVEELCRQGWKVTAFCLPSDNSDVLPAAVTVTLGNITDIESLRAAMPPAPDAVFHVAGNTSTWSKNARQQYQDNVTGTTNIVDVALQKSAKRLVYTSSISAYGYQPGRRIDENTPSNVLTHGDNYGQTKFHAEQRIRQAISQRHLSAVILNPVNILGPYDRHNWSRQLILPISQGSLRVVPPGAATWAYVDDIVAAHIAAVDKGRPGENYILGGVEASFMTVVNEIEDILGRPPSRRVTPKAMLRIGLWAATARSSIDGRQPPLTPPQYRRAVGDLLCSDEKAQRELEYHRTDLHTMLAATIGWLRHESLLDGERFASEAAATAATVRQDNALGVEYVEVADEPRHIEQLRNDHVRVYLATIEPGTRTLYHRHRANTLYVVMAGGLSRSDEPGHQRRRTGVGRSIGTATKLAIALRRGLFGTVRLPTGAVLMHYHKDFPLTHRLCAAVGNPDPIRMLGVELLPQPDGPQHGPEEMPGLSVEYHDRQATTYRIRLAPGQSTGPLHTGRPALLAMVTGRGQSRLATAETPGRPLASATRTAPDGQAACDLQWLNSDDDCTLSNPGPTTLDALLIAVNQPAGKYQESRPQAGPRYLFPGYGLASRRVSRRRSAARPRGTARTGCRHASRRTLSWMPTARARWAGSSRTS